MGGVNPPSEKCYFLSSSIVEYLPFLSDIKPSFRHVESGIKYPEGSSYSTVGTTLCKFFDATVRVSFDSVIVVKFKSVDHFLIPFLGRLIPPSENEYT